MKQLTYTKGNCKKKHNSQIHYIRPTGGEEFQTNDLVVGAPRLAPDPRW